MHADQIIQGTALRHTQLQRYAQHSSNLKKTVPSFPTIPNTLKKKRFSAARSPTHETTASYIHFKVASSTAARTSALLLLADGYSSPRKPAGTCLRLRGDGSFEDSAKTWGTTEEKVQKFS